MDNLNATDLVNIMDSGLDSNGSSFTIKYDKDNDKLIFNFYDLPGNAGQEKADRGGAREGAGRKPNPNKRVSLSCRVKQPTLQLLKETAKETGTGLGAVVDFIVEDYKRRTDSE